MRGKCTGAKHAVRAEEQSGEPGAGTAAFPRLGAGQGREVGVLGLSVRGVSVLLLFRDQRLGYRLYPGRKLGWATMCRRGRVKECIRKNLLEGAGQQRTLLCLHLGSVHKNKINNSSMGINNYTLSLLCCRFRIYSAWPVRTSPSHKMNRQMIPG